MPMFGSSSGGLLPYAVASGAQPGAIPRQMKIMAALSALKGDYGPAMQMKMLPYQIGAAQQLQGMFAPKFAGDAPQVPDAQISTPAMPGGQSQDGVTSAISQALGGLAPQTAPEAAPQAPQAPDFMAMAKRVPGPSISDPQTQQTLLRAAMMGVPGTDVAGQLLQANQPDVAYDRGFGYNKRTGDPMGAFHPDLDKGITLGPNGAMPVPGYTDAAGQIAGATTNATEAAKASYDLVDVPIGGGATMKLPRAIAAPLLAKQAAQFMGGGSAGAPGAEGQGATFGQTPTLAEQELAKARAATQGEREKTQPASAAMLQDTDNLINQYSSSVHRILGDTLDPKTGQWTKGGGKSEVNMWSAGRIPGHFPALTGQATNLEADIDGLRALISSEKLAEMRRASESGSLNMRTTQGEIFNIFGNLAGPLHQTQDPQALERSLRESMDRLEQTRTVMHNQYHQEFGQTQQPTPGTTQPIAPKARSNLQAVPLQDRLAEARRRGLIQ